MTPDKRALRDAFLAELWPTCPEVPRHVRAEKRKHDRLIQREIEDRTALAELSPAVHTNSPACEQTCAQNGSENVA